jgi:histidinol-phosphatase (PHP family)
MAWFSFHGGHSGDFCKHAEGDLEAVVQAAIAAGFTTYGLSEHAPRLRPEDLYPDEAGLTPDDLKVMFDRYRSTARTLQAKYADRIELLVGFEAPPLTYPTVMESLRVNGGFDYVVGSVHHLGADPIDFSAEQTAALEVRMGGRDAMDQAYFNAVGAMIEALTPEVVGHFDLVRKFRGDDVSFSDETWVCIERALLVAAEVDAVLDVNASPARRGTGPVYPCPDILELARALGVGVTLGDDSHGPAAVGAGLDAALEAIKVAGYQSVACLHRGDERMEQEFVPVETISPVKTGT